MTALIETVLVVSVVVSFVAPLLAARRLKAGDRRFALVMAAPMLATGGYIVWAAVATSYNAPIVGVPFAMGAVLYLLVVFRSVVRFHRATRRVTSPDELLNSAFEVFAEPTVVWAALLLIGSLMAVVALIVWGLAHVGRL